jgi:hypothetical protein
VITTGGFAIPDGTAIRVERPKEKDEDKSTNEPGDSKDEKASPQKPDDNIKTDKDKE